MMQCRFRAQFCPFCLKESKKKRNIPVILTFIRNWQDICETNANDIKLTKQMLSLDSYETDINSHEEEMISEDVYPDSNKNEFGEHLLNYFTGNQLAKAVWTEVDTMSPEDLLSNAEELVRRILVQKAVFKHVLEERIMRCLKMMSDYLTQAAGRMVHLISPVFHSIILLFGICSSRPAYIYAAIFGSSSTRIFS